MNLDLNQQYEELIIKYFDDNFKLTLPENYENHISQNLVIEEYQEIIKEILCPICTEIPLNPIECSNCKNIICKECLKKWNKCPFNCINFKEIELDRTFKKVINLFKTKCPYLDKGCNKIIYFKDYLNHIKNCDYSEFICKVEGCQFKGNKKECCNHIFYCGLKLIKCKYCHKKCFKFKLKEYEEYCGNLIIKCNLCNKDILNKNMEKHKEKECDFSQVKCKKCHKKMIRKDIKLHDVNKCLEYQVEYWKNISKKKDITINQMKEELENVKNELVTERSLNRDMSVKNFLSSGFNLINDKYENNNTET